jgi:putative tryptophan/tyrosine transport system permease protein
MIEGIVIEGLVYGIMALAVFITFRVLDFADMTVDGSFPLGGAVMAVLVTAGVNPFLATACAFLAGSAAGALTAVIHSKLKIPGLLAGILTMYMLKSINLRVMGNRANVSLLKVKTPFDSIREFAAPYLSGELAVLVFLVIAVAVILVAVNVFFHTDFGKTLGALGSNPQLITSQAMNPETLKLVGISLSNGLVGVAGAFSCLYQGFADVNAGVGTVVAGLASLMLGEFLVRSNRIEILTLRVILGSILYRAIMFAGRRYGYMINLNPNDLMLITGILIIICMIVSKYGNGARFAKKAATK